MIKLTGLNKKYMAGNSRSSHFYANSDSVVEQINLDRIALLFFHRVREINVARASA